MSTARSLSAPAPSPSPAAPRPRRQTTLPAEGGHARPPRFTLDTLRRDALAGVVTGLMAVPLTVGICVMSDFPIQVGLLTVVAACAVSFAVYLVRPGNHVGVPGVAAGLAPVLAMGVHTFGMENMPWLIFLTAVLQMIVWRYRLERYILLAVPKFLIEGLLAGVGLKIAMKFLPHTYAAAGGGEGLSGAGRLTVVAASVASLGAFLWLYRRFRDTSPGVPYIAVIAGGAWFAAHAEVPMLHLEPVPLRLAWPLPDLARITPAMHVQMVLYAAMLALIDVIEQVMSNAAIEKLDPLGRKADSNNSLLVMWLANGLSSLFGGMTNLDGLAKSQTNRMAGAVTKMSVLFVAAVLAVVLAFPWLLTRLPEFSLAVLMIFTGWKMIAGLFHVAEHGRYELGLALFCGALVFRMGIFEGLLLCLALHSFIAYVVFRHEHMPRLEILARVLRLFSDGPHPHATATMEVTRDEVSGGLRYGSVARSVTASKDLDAFIDDWAHGINRRNLLSVVSTYDPAGLLWGTFAKELRAGHPQIKRYFEHLFELDRLAVTFESGETRQYGDVYIRSGAYRFTFERRGAPVAVPARYSFVCKRERTGWFILEHHSSEFPA
ncbi:MAG: SulP family inorganic anion transporter [Planctomycetes bacterium]|nr:SulP family inorganic anion transporter [Planctomycetota bacterium]